MKKIIYIFFTLYPIISFSNQYSKSFFYDIIVAPFFNLDNMLNTEDVQITHCSILNEGKVLEDVKKYDGLGSCLFHETPIFDEDNQSQKQVIAHIILQQQYPIDIIISWSSISMYDLWTRNQNQTPLNFSLQIKRWPDGSLSDLLDQILMYVTDENNAHGAVPLLPLILQSEQEVHTINLQVTPLENSFMDVELSLLDEAQQLIDRYSVLTNYYIGSNTFVIASRDRYEHLSSQKKLTTSHTGPQ